MRKILVIFTLVVLFNIDVTAQSHAITVNGQITHYSSHLSDYTDVNRLFVTMLNTDERDVYQGVLKMEITGSGYSINTKADISFGLPVTLYRNTPLILTGSQLSELFNPDQLEFTGVSRDDFIFGGGRLPEGPTSFCFTIYDPNRQETVSNRHCTLGNVSTYDPPQILTPSGQIEYTTPQNIFFSWQPRHVGTFPVDYTLEIYENDANFSYDVILNNFAPVFRKEHLALVYNYSELDPVLLDGQSYLMRVKVNDITDNIQFLNDGWSEVVTFTFGNVNDNPDNNGGSSYSCTSPSGVLVQNNNTEMEVSWEGQINYLEYLSPDCNTWTRVWLEGAASPYIINSFFVGECEEPLIKICRSCSDGDQCKFLNIESINQPCTVVQNPQTSNISNHNIDLNWEANESNDGYIIRYRNIDEANANSDQVFSTTMSALINNLQASTNYEFIICPECSDDVNSNCALITAQTRSDGITQGYCEPPSALNIESTNPNSFNIDWFPTNEGVLYTIEYALATEGDPVWYSDTDLSPYTHTVEGLSPNTHYMVRVCPQCTEGACSDIIYYTTPDESDFSLTSILCNEDYDSYLPPASGPVYASTLQSGDIVKIADFEMALVEVNHNSGTQSYSGTAIIPIPFGGKQLNVSYSNIKVNNKKEVFSGTATGIADTPGYDIMDELPAPITIGGGICIPPPPHEGYWDENSLYQPGGLPYDENGFNQQGQYTIQPPYPGYQEGDPYDPNYDPNGFDNDGNHVSTGTPYNENGCNQAGMDEDGQPCDSSGSGPYYWLNENEELGPATTEGTAYEDQIAPDSLRRWIIDGLNEIKAGYEAEAQILRDECAGLKTRMIELQESLGFHRMFIFGPEDEYINEGLHMEFMHEPLPLSVNVERDPDALELETKHISLYHKDKELFVFLRKIDIINTELEDPSLDVSENELREKMQRFTQEQIDAFNADHSAAIRAWVKDEMNTKIEDIYSSLYGADTGMNDAPADQMLSPSSSPSSTPYTTGLLAAGALSDEDMSQLMSEALNIDTDEDFRFQYKQGWEEINGVHRAHILKRIANKRKEGFFPPTDPGNNLNTNVPVEVEKEVLGQTYTLLLDNIRFTPSNAIMDAYLVLELPNEQEIAFGTQNVEFTPSGPSSVSRLSLATDIEIRLSNAALLTIKGSEDTYVAFDCEGFDGMGIDAGVEFCRRYLTPLDPVTYEPLVDTTERVSVDFTAEMPAWGEFIVEVNIDPFAVTGKEDVAWVVNRAVFDFSETENAENIIFPENYSSPFVHNGHASNLWKGFYLQELSVHLPDELTGGETDGSTVGVQNVIIDDRGFTGSAFIEPLLSLDKGNLSGWAFSIDRFEVNVIANQFESCGFEGKIHVPLFKGSEGGDDDEIAPEDCFDYVAEIRNRNDYAFAVSPSSDMEIPLCLATAHLDSTTTIVIQKREGNFDTFAELHGSLTIGGDNALGIETPEITYQGMVLSNRAPYFREQGTWGVSGNIEAEFKGFGFSISSGGMRQISGGAPEDVGFQLGIRLNLTPADEEGISACTNLLLVGQMRTFNERQKWVYDHVKVKDINLNASGPGFAVQGCLSFFDNDPGVEQFGTGFKGMVSAWFTGVNKNNQEGSETSSSETSQDSTSTSSALNNNLSAACSCSANNIPTSGGWGFAALGIFGTTDYNSSEDYRYFMVDVMAKFGDNGLPVGPINITGFGGGISKHMERHAPLQMALSTASAPTDEPSEAAMALGSSLSGTSYTPDRSMGVGLRATVAFTVQKENAFNANVTFEIMFNARDEETGEGGGINNIALYGNCAFMNEPNMDKAPTFGESGAPNNGAAVNAFFDMEYDFENKTFHAGFEVFVNAMNGALTGGGQAVIHFAPNEWYINVGWPSDDPLINKRIRLDYDIPALGRASLTAYLDIGQNIPPMPSPPAYVTELTGAGNFMLNESLRATGRGFAFGAAFDITTGRRRFWPFYAEFGAGLGFDINVQDYGDAYCTNTNAPLGINGWYASGQAWAYLQGTVGIEVNLLFVSGEFEILDIGAAAIIQAKLPNPFWGRGSVGGRYNILGGLVKGTCNFQLTLGETCDMEGGEDPYADFPLILDVSPQNESTAYTNVIPSAQFFTAIGQEIDTGEEIYIPQLEYARLTNANTGDEIEGTLEIDPYGYSLTFIPDELLFSPANYTFEVKVVLMNGGQVLTEEIQSTTFTCFQNERRIPEENVSASYPLDNQLNFYKEEYYAEEGYIFLKRDQSYLFNVPSAWEQVARFTQQQNDSRADDESEPIRNYFEVPITYSSSELKITFEMDPSQFTNGGLYKMEIINKIPESNGEQQETASGSTGRHGGYDFDEFIQASESTNYTEEILYSIVFRVSEYDTFYEKIQDFDNSLSFDATGQEGLTLLYNANLPEPFESYETIGSGELPALVQIEAKLLNTPWYIGSSGLAIMYAQMPNFNNLIGCDYELRWRAYDAYGESNGWPTKSVFFLSSNTATELSDEYFQNGSVPNTVFQSEQVLEYSTGFIAKYDALDLYNIGYGAPPPDPNEEQSENNSSLNPGCYWEERNDEFGQGRWYFNPPRSGFSGEFWNIIRNNKERTSMPSGNYPVLVRYVLPEINYASSERTITLQY